MVCALFSHTYHVTYHVTLCDVMLWLPIIWLWLCDTIVMWHFPIFLMYNESKRKKKKRNINNDLAILPSHNITGYYLQKYIEPVDYDLQKRFQTLIGSLLYLMLGTRLDITFAITLLAWHTANLSLDHFNWALYVYYYLVGTQDYSFIYKEEIDLRISVMNIEWDYNYYQPWSDNEWLVNEMLAILDKDIIM